MALNRSIVRTVQEYSTSAQSNVRFVSLTDTNVLGQSGADIVAKFLLEMAFGYQPTLTTKVDYLIDPLQSLDVRLKSESLDVWDYLESASHPIF